MQIRTDLGLLLSPSAWRLPYRDYWATDNDVFSHREDPDWWEREGETRWLKMLDKIPADNPPQWVLLPDVVADWDRTVERACLYRDEVVSRGLRYAIALQNGCEFEDALALGPDTVFVGGTVEWKWRVAEAVSQCFLPMGIGVHVGRVSGPRRVRECLRIGATSCDGTGWARFPNKMLPGLFRVLDGKDPQLRMDYEDLIGVSSDGGSAIVSAGDTSGLLATYGDALRKTSST